MNIHNEINMDNEGIRLITPDIEYMKSYIEASNENIAAKIFEFAPLEDEYKASEEAFKKYLTKLEEHKKGINLKKGYVPYSTFWLVDQNNKIFIGRINLRHFLNDNLLTFGGHIGYIIRPSYWGLGMGTMQLNLLLPEAKKLGLPKVRLTCYKENIPSAKVMEKNGAKLIAETVNRINGTNRLTLIYEIPLDNV